MLLRGLLESETFFQSPIILKKYFGGLVERDLNRKDLTLSDSIIIRNEFHS